MSNWFTQLFRFLGGDNQPTPPEAKAPPKVSAEPATPTTPANVSTPHRQLRKPQRPRAPTPKSAATPGRDIGYLIVVGLDFGTAYTKCVIRDALVRDPGKAYPVPFELAGGWSYLVPSVVVRQQTNLASAFDGPLDGANERIDYLKMRLVSELDQQRAGAWRDGETAGEMQVLVAWFIAQVLARVGLEIRRRWPDYGSHLSDECFINICVPIAHADGSMVEQCLLDALCAARNAVGPCGAQAPTVAQIRINLSDETKLRQARSHCYTYPETSANLQSYLKSRARRPGLYLFADVGAGTVDLSFFQLLEDTGKDAPLLYYHAAVLDAGSSRLELKAKTADPELLLSELIAAKEGHVRRPNNRILRALTAARKTVHDEVGLGVGNGVTVTEAKLHLNRYNQLTQMRNVKMMHAGGGYALDPYGHALRFFHKHRQWGDEPPLHSLPVPDDLVWSTKGKQIPFTRLSVAYGLAFARYELDGHRFPSEMAVNPDITGPEPVERPTAPTMDEV